MAWTELDPTRPVAASAGELFAAVASVKKTHPEATIRELLAGKGLAVVDYAEQGQRAGLGPDPSSGYRYVAVMVQARQAAEIPTEVPFPLSVFDASHVVRLWELEGAPPPPNVLPAPPAPGAPERAATPSPWPLVAGLALVAVGGAAGLSRRRRKRRMRK